MNKFILALLLLCAPAFCKAKPEVIEAHKATLVTSQKVVGEESTECSATVIAPQALLTASHCEKATDYMYVSGVDVDTNIEIKVRLRDGLDHTIYLVDGITFPHIAKLDQNDLTITDDVFICGNPGNMSDIFRKGYFAGVEAPQETLASLFGGQSSPPTLIFDLNVFHGDSGAAIFTSDGVVAEVVSGTVVQGEGKDTNYFMYAYPMNFKKEQLDQAQAFKTEQKKDPDVNKPNTPAPAGPVTPPAK